MRRIHVLAAAILFSSLLRGCSTPEPATRAPGREPLVTSVRRIGVVGSVAARRAGASAYDGGWSIPFGKDEVLWVFDQTWFGSGDVTGAPGRSQSGLLAARADWRGGESTARWLGG